MKYESVLYGTKIGQPDHMEDIISIYPNEFKKATEWAKDNGFDRLEVRTIDLNTKPDFINTLN